MREQSRKAQAEQLREQRLARHQQRRIQRATKELQAAAPPTRAARPSPPRQRPVIRPDIHARFQAIVRRVLEAPD